ncbi:MAG: response regulator [Planctomycetes bacterium]|nr:response regulator [Planctomycetota bacterium]
MARDPYQYFRVEAHELLEKLTQGILDLEKGAGKDELVGRLLRQAHTLKGAARVVKQPKISELAHSLEGALAPYREGGAVIPKDRVNEMLSMLDAISAGLGSLVSEADQVNKPSENRPVTEESIETVRVDVGELDTLLNGLSEIGFCLSSIRREAEALNRARQLADFLLDEVARLGNLGNGPRGWAGAGKVAPIAEEIRALLNDVKEGLAIGLQQSSAELAQARDTATQLRLLPSGAIFASLERAARDAAQTLQKKIKFEATGGETRLDAYVLAALQDALIHVVRNAVAHGIETEPQRAASGKPLAGAVRLLVERRGNRIAFICQDDGGGIDVTALRQAAVKRGLLEPGHAEAPSLEEIVQLILRGGVSTTGAVTEVSGRGIGLDVVRATAARLKGEVSIRSERGRGTAVEVCVPVSLASLAALRVESAEMTASIPLDAVKRTVRVNASDLVRSGDGVSMVSDGLPIPFLSLTELLEKRTGAANYHRPRVAVIVQASNGLAAIGVERLLGTANIVARSLPPSIDPEEFIAGASLNTEGNPELVLNPRGLVLAASANKSLPKEPETPNRHPVLVIDDSLTTRMLERSILESAGYEVDFAISAEDALEKARGRKYDLFIVDVEMPGMDGFDFVERVRSDPLLREVPSILVTSRGSPEDRLRGKRVGARAYMVKDEFNQDSLLQTIRNLVG